MTQKQNCPTHVIGAFRILHCDWRGHHISTTMASLEGRLHQKLQSKSAFSLKIVRYTVCFAMVL